MCLNPFLLVLETVTTVEHLSCLTCLGLISMYFQQGTSQKVLMTNNMSEEAIGWNLLKRPKIHF